MASWKYVYCILEGRDLPPGDHHGLEDAPVRAEAYRGISMAVSPLFQPRVPASMRNLLLHERLVEGLMAQRPLLPVRFGTVLRDTTSVRLALSQGYGGFLQGLELVRGKVELGIRVLAPEQRPELEAAEEAVPVGPGARYLMERLRLSARVRAAREPLERYAKLIDAALMHHSERRQDAMPSSQNMVASAAYLVWQHKVAAFKREVELQRERFPELQFLLTGPWPPYSFVGDVGQGTGSARFCEVLGPEGPGYLPGA